MTEAYSDDEDHKPYLPVRPKYNKAYSDSRLEKVVRSKKSVKLLRPPTRERRNTLGKSHKSRSGREITGSHHSMMKTDLPRTLPKSWADAALANNNDGTVAHLTKLNKTLADPYGFIPGDVYQPNGGDLPVYVHEVIHHCINHTALAFVPSNDPGDLAQIKAHIWNSIVSDALSWYTVVLAGVTHLSFMRAENEIPRDKQMLRFSYKSGAISGILKDIADSKGEASDRVLLAMCTLASHGALDEVKGFTHDRIQDRKAFGAANDMNYYTALQPGQEHWDSLVRIIEERGGIKSTLGSPGLFTGIAFCDIWMAWRNFSPPKFPAVIDTEAEIKKNKHKPDAEAISYARRLLSGFSSMVDNRWLFAKLMTRLKHMRCILVDYEQWQRKSPQLPDIRRIYWIRHFVLHDLLSMPIIGSRLGGNVTELGYELIRLSCLGFMQLVIYPMAAINDIPSKILEKTVPLLEAWTKPAEGKILSQDHPGIFLWSLMLSSMLAFEHYETHSDPQWMDSVARYFDRVSIKAEKRAWPMVKAIMGTYLWLGSECDGPGQRAWNYACLWLAAREEE